MIPASGGSAAKPRLTAKQMLFSGLGDAGEINSSDCIYIFAINLKLKCYACDMADKVLTMGNIRRLDWQGYFI